MGNDLADRHEEKERLGFEFVGERGREGGRGGGERLGLEFVGVAARISPHNARTHARTHARTLACAHFSYTSTPPQQVVSESVQVLSSAVYPTDDGVLFIQATYLCTRRWL